MDEAPGALSAALGGSGTISSTANATANIASDILASGELSAELGYEQLGSLVANLDGAGELSSLANATANISAALAGEGDATGTIPVSDLSANIFGVGSVVANLTFINNAPISQPSSSGVGNRFVEKRQPRKTIVGSLSAHIIGRSNVKAKATLIHSVSANVTGSGKVAAKMKKSFTAADNQLWLL